MEVPFAVDSFESVIEDYIEEDTVFNTHNDADASFDYIAQELGFGPKKYGLKKNKKNEYYVLRRYRCSLEGEKDTRHKVDGLDPKLQRERTSRKCECTFRAHASYDRLSQTWEIITDNPKHNHGPLKDLHAEPAFRRKKIKKPLDEKIAAMHQAGEAPQRIVSDMPTPPPPSQWGLNGWGPQNNRHLDSPYMHGGRSQSFTPAHSQSFTPTHTPGATPIEWSQSPSPHFATPMRATPMRATPMRELRPNEQPPLPGISQVMQSIEQTPDLSQSQTPAPPRQRRRQRTTIPDSEWFTGPANEHLPNGNLSPRQKMILIELCVDGIPIFVQRHTTKKAFFKQINTEFSELIGRQFKSAEATLNRWVKGRVEFLEEQGSGDEYADSPWTEAIDVWRRDGIWGKEEMNRQVALSEKDQAYKTRKAELNKENLLNTWTGKRTVDSEEESEEESVDEEESSNTQMTAAAAAINRKSSSKTPARAPKRQRKSNQKKDRMQEIREFYADKHDIEAAARNSATASEIEALTRRISRMEDAMDRMKDENKDLRADLKEARKDIDRLTRVVDNINH